MDPEKNPEKNIVPRTFFRMPKFPSLWEEMEDRMGQWMGLKNDSGVSVSEDDNNIYVEAQVPGLKPEDIDVSVQQNTLLIKAERQEEEVDKDRKYYRQARKSFYYQVELPGTVEEHTEQANYEHGVLKISFKKSNVSPKRKISVKSENQNQKIDVTKKQ